MRANLSVLQRLLIVAISGGIVFSACFYFILLPQKKNYSILNHDFKTKAKMLTESEIKTSQIEVLSNKIKELKKQLPVNSREKLASTTYLPVLFENVNKIGRDLNLEISIKEGRLIEREFHQELPVEIIIQGRYHKLGKFITSISKLQWIIKISEIDCKPLNNNANPELNIASILKGYIYLSKGSF